MSLAAGQRLGPYAIEASLGSGGMGEVYRARDMRIGRAVAIKVLPAAAAGDAVRIERFEREARAIGALNHPNICALYDVGDESGRAFLVMELLEGETLQAHLRRGPMDVAAIVDAAIALADALDAAHAQGLLHRDLKPANIFLTTRGQVKILDFGLARAMQDADDRTRAAAEQLTDAGTAVGTVGYMSPEQLRAKPVDARTDLFSLGAVLYEMAAGQRAFGGDTSAEISGAVLYDTPAPLLALRPDLPEKLAEAIQNCLEKDRDLRVQSATELRAQFKRVKRTSDPAAPAAQPASASAPAALHSRASGQPAARTSSDAQVAVGLAKRHPIALAAGAVVVASLAAATYFYMRHSASSAAPAAVGGASLEVEAITDSGDSALGALSPDGRFVAHVRSINQLPSLWIRQLTTRSDAQIAPPVRGRRFVGVSITPDGSFVDFVATDPGVRPPALWRVPFLGGTPTRIASDVWSATGWSPDGRHFAFIRSNAAAAVDQLIVADADGANERVVVTRRPPDRFQSDSNNSNAISRPTWSPDGKEILAIGRHTESVTRFSLVRIDASTGATQATPMSSAVLDSAWMDAFHALANVYSDDKTPSLVLVDLRDGSSVRVTPAVSTYLGASVTPDRRAAVTSQTIGRSSFWLGDETGGNLQEMVPDAPSFVFYASVSDTGTIVYQSVTVLKGFGITVSSSENRSALRTVLTSADGNPIVSADGRTITFARGGAGGGVYTAAIDGTGARKLVDGHDDANHVAVSGDGRTVVFRSRTREGYQSLWAAPASGGAARELTHQFVSASSVSITPDSRRVLFVGGRPTPTSKTPVLECDLPDCARLHQVQHRDGVWTPDGRGIAYVDSADPSNIAVEPIDGGPSRPLTHFTGQPIIGFGWSPNGKRLLIVRGTLVVDVVLIKGFGGAQRP